VIFALFVRFYFAASAFYHSGCGGKNEIKWREGPWRQLAKVGF